MYFDALYIQVYTGGKNSSMSVGGGEALGTERYEPKVLSPHIGYHNGADVSKDKYRDCGGILSEITPKRHWKKKVRHGKKLYLLEIAM
jgi:hypothetical protein